MKGRTAYIRHLRQSRRSALAALFAMLFQTLFAMEHVSALAAAAARGNADGGPAGFMEICTARGILRIAIPASPATQEERNWPQLPRSGSNIDCAVCGTAAIAGASAVPSMPALLAPAPVQVISIPPFTHSHLSATGFKRAGTTRGPPCFPSLQTF